jgi:hypothetical protein
MIDADRAAELPRLVLAASTQLVGPRIVRSTIPVSILQEHKMRPEDTELTRAVWLHVMKWPDYRGFQPHVDSEHCGIHSVAARLHPGGHEPVPQTFEETVNFLDARVNLHQFDMRLTARKVGCLQAFQRTSDPVRQFIQMRGLSQQHWLEQPCLNQLSRLYRGLQQITGPTVWQLFMR